jgi:histidine triad (HIT) family protein
MDECVFCKIVAGELPATLVAETELSIAFNDRHPRQAIHVLVVPKKHFTDVAELATTDEASLADLMKLGAQVAENLSTGSFRFQFNTGAEAGQTVFHAHGHITSRTPRAE